MLLPAPAPAQLPFGLPCATQQDRQAAVDLVLAQIDEHAMTVESVPPADREYIQREERASMQLAGDGNVAGAEARFGLLVQHRFYDAYQVHEAFDDVRNELSSAAGREYVGYYIQDLAEALSRLIVLRGEIENYLDADALRAEPIQQSRSSLTFPPLLLSSSIMQLIGCATAPDL